MLELSRSRRTPHGEHKSSIDREFRSTSALSTRACALSGVTDLGKTFIQEPVLAESIAYVSWTEMESTWKLTSAGY